MAISSNEGYISIEFGAIHMGWRGPERCAPWHRPGDDDLTSIQPLTRMDFRVAPA
jgi:hypothetical protein